MTFIFCQGFRILSLSEMYISSNSSVKKRMDHLLKHREQVYVAYSVASKLFKVGKTTQDITKYSKDLARRCDENLIIKSRIVNSCTQVEKLMHILLEDRKKIRTIKDVKHREWFYMDGSMEDGFAQLVSLIYEINNECVNCVDTTQYESVSIIDTLQVDNSDSMEIVTSEDEI